MTQVTAQQKGENIGQGPFSEEVMGSRWKIWSEARRRRWRRGGLWSPDTLDLDKVPLSAEPVNPYSIQAPVVSVSVPTSHSTFCPFPSVLHQRQMIGAGADTRGLQPARLRPDFAFPFFGGICRQRIKTLMSNIGISANVYCRAPLAPLHTAKGSAAAAARDAIMVLFFCE